MHRDVGVASNTGTELDLGVEARCTETWFWRGSSQLVATRIKALYLLLYTQVSVG